MNNVELTDEIIYPVMEKHSISREEAEKRLQLLYKSGILRQPDDLRNRLLIDDFLAQDSETLEVKVAFEICMNACISNPDFVRQYDRITHNNLAKSLRKAESGLPPSNFEKKISDFGKFVRDTVFEKWAKAGDF